MLEIREAIVVEGRYDKIALEPVVKTSIFTTDGFQIFSDKKKISLLRRVAESRGLIVFTDSDGAGLLIRSRLRSCIDAKYLKHAYIPDVPGKERRKRTASKAGTLGVEGMPPALLEEALRRAGATFGAYHPNPVTKAELFALGLWREELCCPPKEAPACPGPAGKPLRQRPAGGDQLVVHQGRIFSRGGGSPGTGRQNFRSEGTRRRLIQAEPPDSTAPWYPAEVRRYVSTAPVSTAA